MDRGLATRGDRRTRLDNRQARPSMAAPALLIGSLILLASTFLDWASTAQGVNGTTETGTTTASLSGYNVPDGRIAGGIGLALLVVAVLMWANKRVGSWFDADVLGGALSAIAVGTIALFLVAVGDGGLSAELGPYVGLVGAAIALIGAIAAAVRSGSDRATADEEGRGDIGRDTRAVA
jgi:hypothetical protein